MRLTTFAAVLAGLVALGGPALASGKTSPTAPAGAHLPQADRILSATTTVADSGAVVAKVHRTFPDVPPDHWAAQAVQLMANLGIMIGYPDGTFNGGNSPAR